MEKVTGGLDDTSKAVYIKGNSHLRLANHRNSLGEGLLRRVFFQFVSDIETQW